MIDWQSKVIAPLVKAFGAPGVYTQDGTSYSLSGVYDEAYSFVDVSSGMPVTTTAPCFGFNTRDLPVTARQKDRMAINGRSYIVRNAQPDGHGWCRLMLNLAPVFPDVPRGIVQDA